MKVPKRKTKKGIINGALKLISNRDHWIQGISAVNKRGGSVFPESLSAERFCAYGALAACSDNAGLLQQTYNCVDEFCRQEYGTGLVAINDGHNSNEAYEKVIKILTNAVEVCK